MDVAAADPAGGYFDENVIWARLRSGQIGDAQMTVFGKEKSFHGRKEPRAPEYSLEGATVRWGVPVRGG